MFRQDMAVTRFSTCGISMMAGLHLDTELSLVRESRFGVGA